MSDEAWRFTRV